MALPAPAPGRTAAAGPWRGAGRGFRAHPSLAALVPGTPVGLFDLLPQARAVLALAQPAVRAGLLRSPIDAVPVYVRDEVAKASTVLPSSS